MPIVPGEGPFGMIIYPSRELAKQTYGIIEQFLLPLKEAGYLEIRPFALHWGCGYEGAAGCGEEGRAHCGGLVTTPGRLKDLLAKEKIWCIGKKPLQSTDTLLVST